ncbi:hypothetical protein ABL78_4585 [Leptomonas seymouri]|uniref:Uncharacterized protein n=1 Tax=Leptomonas seymouri TaxID=5684 RepID=A0A0N0P5E2_LEPSE|nr:hypothetical protein ABL78_4585 [Leptomonas seymouri]|eukprot:KPI86359.1 hypothetical protein ABL78_4585 [Leptomonas seymouri]
MSAFSTSALEILQAAEDALTQPRNTKRSALANTCNNTIDYNGLHYSYTLHQEPNSNCHTHGASEASTVRELQSQLSRVMRELIELRAELAAERDHRNDTLVALGRQWREEVMVAVHRRDSSLQSDVAELEEKLTAQWRESNESRVVLRRQLEDAVRAAKVRDTDRFQLREELQETTRQVEERVEVALAQSTAARADCSRQLEQERASLSQRLDSELLRLVEMRSEDQRALQDAREALRRDGQRMREEVQRAVQEVWESSATALVKTATEPVEQLRAELRRCMTAVQAAEEKVTDCVRSCQAECRLHTTTTAERLHALEAKEAVAASRIDRAERKADGSYEVVHRMESSVQSAKDATERAQLQAASALERAQKVEHALSDRDARLIAVESHLHAVSTAEGLKAEVEACKRQVGRLESRMDATGALCERVEQLADKTVRQVNDCADRIGGCEKSVQRSAEVVQGVQEAMAACQAGNQQARDRDEIREGVVQRHGQLLTQLEQRIVGQESRLGLWRQQQEQHTKDQQMVQREMTERAEATHAMATRAQQVSSDARAEVSRLERRFDDIDRAITSSAKEATAQRATGESLRAQGLEMQRKQQHLEDQLRVAEAQVQERVLLLAELERNVAQRFKQSGSHTERLEQKLVHCEKQLQEMGGRVHDYLKDAIHHHAGESQRRLLAALNEGLSRVSEKVSTVEHTVTEMQARSGSMPKQLQTLQANSTTLQRSLQALDGRLESLRGNVDQLALHAEARGGDHQRLSTIQKDLSLLAVGQQRLQQDLLHQQEMMQTLREMQLSAGRQTRDQTLSQLGGSQAQTASTEMARAHEAGSSSPSAVIPADAGQRFNSPMPTVSPSTAMESQLAEKAAAIPPQSAQSTKTSPRMQTPQGQQRASSGSTNSSRGGSVGRPPSHLSGVSSVRPTEEAARLCSIAEQAADTTSDDDGDGTHEVAAIEPHAKSSERSPQTSTLPSVQGAAAVDLSAGAETAEKLCAPALASSAQASGIANMSHLTIIRGFTTIGSTPSDSDTDVSGLRRQQQQQQQSRSALQQRAARVAAAHEEDISSDVTTAVTLTIEAAVTPVTEGSGVTGGLRPQPSTVQRRAVTTVASGQQQQQLSSLDSSPERIPPAPARVGQPANTQADRRDVKRAGEVRLPGSEDDDDSDAVQAVVAQSSSEEGGDDSNSSQVEHLPAAGAHRGNAWAADQGGTPLEPRQRAHAAAARVEARGTEGGKSSAAALRPPQWDDWDEGETEDDDDGRGHAVKEPTAPAAQADSSGGSDMVMPMRDVGAGSDSSAASTDTSTTSTAPRQAASSAAPHHQRISGGGAEELRATERRVFVSVTGGTAGGSPAPRHVVPRHGQNTTSSSSSSAERMEALGLQRTGPTATAQRPVPQVRHYTNFDDSTTSDDD